MDDSERQTTSLASILELSRLVCSSLELSVVFERILAAVRDLSGAEIISIMLIDEQGEHLRFVAAIGLAPEMMANPSFRLGEGVAGWVALHGVPVHTADLSGDQRFVPVYTPAGSTLFSLPLQVRNHTLGVLNLARAGNGELFSAATVQMVEIFASHAAIAIDNAAAATSLRYAATRERMVRLVNQASPEPGASAPVIEQILAELGEALELAIAVVYRPEGEGGYRPFAAAPSGVAPRLPWLPAKPALAVAEQRTEAGWELQMRLTTRHGLARWLSLARRSPGHFWRRDERDLARFAADQIALLLTNEQLALREQQSRALSYTLSQLAAACNAMVGQESLLDFILEQLARFIDYDSSGVFLYHDNHYARMVAGRGFRQAREGVVLYMGPGSTTWAVRQQRHALYLPDVQKIAAWQSVPDSDIIRSWIGVPLLANDAVIGMLTIDKWQPGAFSQADVQVAQLFADHVAVAVNNQKLLRDAQTQASQIKLLHQLSARMSTFREPGALLDEIAHLVHASFSYYQVCMFMVEGDELVLRAGYGEVPAADMPADERRYSLQHGLIGVVARTGETLLVNDVAQDPRFIPSQALPMMAAQLGAAIRHEGYTLGVIVLESEQRGAFSQHDVYLIEALASHTAIALEYLGHDEELRRTEEHLAHSERLRALGELASGVAHDFNNLLASILGHTQLLLGDALDERIVAELRVIERAALDGAASVRRLQSFAQTSKTLPAAAVDLGELIVESLAITRPRWRDAAQSRGVEILVLHELAAIPPFLGDGPALRDLSTNLVLNAIDAMPEGGRLELRTAALAAEESPLGEPSALLTVSDTGVGMSPEVQAQIFAPFFTTKGPQGTGMGLTMVAGIVQHHQGLISVSSEPGQGTTFAIYLPARPALGPATAPEAPAIPDGARRQVLVVDDDEAVRHVLSRQIGRLGHVVAEAGSGEEALAMLAATPFDLICTDLGMPGMSGWELIARVRALRPDLQTVLVTGWGEQIDPELAGARGVDAVIAKPFDQLRLKQVLADLTAQRG